ncbi:response regulator [Actinoplanes sp. URMC 104]|uniref:response regulator n=1 Tax=Actinoplanes sp. URMC 104 TaxID=3423409 RepID=UPI003F1BC05C
MIRVVLADDQALVRAGFTLLLNLQPDMEVVGEAADGRQALAVVRATRPDVVLMDIRMPVLDGLEATRRLVGARSPARVLMLTTFDLDEYVYEAMRAGASGFLLKDVGHELLFAGVRTVAAGDALVAPTVTRRLIEQFVRRPPAGAGPPAEFARLTARELEVLRLLARGLTNAEIAGELTVADQTVKTHVAHLLAKLGLRDRVQAVVLAYETGLIVPGDRTHR